MCLVKTLNLSHLDLLRIQAMVTQTGVDTTELIGQTMRALESDQPQTPVTVYQMEAGFD
jgi:hypothetical protein